MNNYYFSYLMKEYGENKINNLISSVLDKGKIHGQITAFNMDDWNFLYFFSVYFCVLLNHFGLDINQIELCLDIVIAPGWSKMFKPKRILKMQKDLIPEIEEFIQKELNEYNN